MTEVHIKNHTIFREHVTFIEYTTQVDHKKLEQDPDNRRAAQYDAVIVHMVCGAAIKFVGDDIKTVRENFGPSA